MSARLETFVRWQRRPQLVVPNLCATPYLASFVPECIRNLNQILLLVSDIRNQLSGTTCRRSVRRDFARRTWSGADCTDRTLC